MSRAEPLVSVIIPTYNREVYLREAIASVFAQTYANWELIVVDDGSTDGSREYLASLPDAPVQVVPLEHSGVPARVRNVGLSRAAGRYVAFLDDDDLWVPEKLALQVADLAGKPNCRWSFTRCAWMDARGHDIPPPTQRTWRPCAGWIFEAVIRMEAWVALPSVVVDRTAMQDIGGFDEGLLLCEDYDAWLKLAMRWEATAVERPVTRIRVHLGNNTGRRIEALEQMVELYRRLVNNPDAVAARPVARLQCARMALALSARHRVEGTPSGAIRAAAVAALYHPADAGWLVALLKACLRPLMPAAVLRLYYRLRNT